MIYPYLFLFLSAFDPQLPFFPNGIGFSLVVSLLLAPFSLLKLKNSGKSNCKFFINKSLPLFSIFFVAGAFIIIRIIINGGENVEFILSWLKAFFVFVSCFSTYLIFYSEKKPPEFIKALVIVYVFNAVVNFSAGTYPEYFQFLSVFKSNVISDSLGANPYRNSFISGSGYFSIGTAYGLIVFLFAFYLVHSKSKSAMLAISIAFTAISGFFAARTAFFAIAPALFYVFKSRIIYFIFFMLTGTALIYLLLDLPALRSYKNWMISFFLFSSDRSAEYLIQQMYFWPGEAVVIFGLGAVNDGTFVYTDAGYMQDILFGGVLFLLIKLCFVLYFVYLFLFKYPLYVMLVVFSILAFHFKGLFLYNNAQGMAAFYFIFFYLWSLSERGDTNSGERSVGRR
ncbi:hypothetical protein [Aestuariirhabdus litorea]|nr:hypothetical protein [Aestuariirhabdus litorea]RWW97719.1 hypothetical protein DZC74_05140 [Endozoicomonadaceae bacterium GTF-13]